MRFLRWGAFVTWLIVAGLAIAGFAAFSPEPVDSSSTIVIQFPSVADASAIGSGPAIDRGTTTGRILAMAFAVAGRDASGPIPEIAIPDPATTFVDPPADERPRATSAPTTTASVSPSTSASATTTTAPEPSTTTTSAESDPTIPRSEYQWPNGAKCAASWYGPGFEGRATASGEPFDPKAFTAALHDVPFDTFVVVTRVDTGDAVTVRVNDRGPFIWDGKWKRHPSRCIDLSQAAMAELGGIGEGVVEVTINY